MSDTFHLVVNGHVSIHTLHDNKVPSFTRVDNVLSGKSGMAFLADPFAICPTAASAHKIVAMAEIVDAVREVRRFQSEMNWDNLDRLLEAFDA